MPKRYFIANARDLGVRAAVITVIAAVILFAWFAVRWQLGNMLAELTSPNQPNAEEIAGLAQRLAPRDPLSHWLAATKEKEVFAPENLENAVRMFEQVVRLSPYDFRWWIELGRAYEQSEQPEKAEAAFARAVELAPSYTFPHWQFGNFYLRQGRSEEAFAELRKTTEKSAVYREQVFSLAWDYFDRDTQQLESIISDSPDVRATLALFYAARGHADGALRVWNTLTDEEKSRHQASARNIAQGLYDKRRYRESLEFAKQTGIDPEAEYETVTNAGFEKFLGPANETLFGWQVYRNEPRLDIMPDSSVKTEGTKSLRIAFKGYAKPEMHNVVQIIALHPGRSYRLTFSLRVEDLRSGGPPMLQVLAGEQNAVIASTQPFPAGSLEWTEVSVEFNLPDDADGIMLRTARSSCPDPCPIFGTIWYDNFRLTRL